MDSAHRLPRWLGAVVLAVAMVVVVTIILLTAWVATNNDFRPSAPNNGPTRQVQR